MDEGEFEEFKQGRFVAAAVAAGVGSAIDLVAPGAGSPSSVALDSLLNALGRGVARRRAQANKAVEVAIETSGVTPEAFGTLLESDGMKLELLMTALTAASITNMDAKIDALGRSLATGALSDDHAVIDVEMYFVRALADIEAPHVRVLNIVTKNRIKQQNAVVYKIPDLAWTTSQIAQAYPQSQPLLPSLLATLVALGAVHDVAVGTLDYVAAYRATEFGDELLHRLHQRASLGGGA